MKKLILLLVFVPALGFGQIPANYLSQQVLGTTYANSTTDSSQAAVAVGGYNNIAVRSVIADSCNLVYRFYKREFGLSAWTAIAAATGDTIVSTAGTQIIKSITLRNNVTDRLGVITAPSCRLRVVVSALTNNGDIADNNYTVFVEVSK